MDASKAKQRLAERPAFPDCLQHAWNWFEELSAARQSGMTANPISYTEIAAWAALNRLTPTRFEVACIKVLDMEYMEAISG